MDLDVYHVTFILGMLRGRIPSQLDGNVFDYRDQACELAESLDCQHRSCTSVDRYLDYRDAQLTM